MLGSTPFVLLDDAREGGAPARLYRNPVRIVSAHKIAEVAPALALLRKGQTEGLHAAGYLTYEAGATLVAGVPPVSAEGLLLWFGLFTDYAIIDDVAAMLPDPAGAWAGAGRPVIDRATYDQRLARILELIAAGDIYQANLTFQAVVPIAGDVLALYARLRLQARAGYGALIDTGAVRLLSLSPELFFALEGDRLACRPMKGTATRGATPGSDRAAAATLATDPKQRAENLMIVDLMRNDLSRTAVAGSVAVPELFAVETYPTVHQMTSSVTATIAPGHDAIDVIGMLYPCGSITGAPKARAMAVISEVEAGPRGAYTGTIGRIDASGDAMFNVAIRTLVIGDGEARMGIGSGIVADSRADDEYDECLAKAAFVTSGQRRFDLIETMAFNPLTGVALLERHLARMRASADLFGFSFDRHAARNELQAATFRLRTGRKVRLLLARSGAIAIEVGALPIPPCEPISVAIRPLPVAAHDFRLRHKTSDRAFYDVARRTADCVEIVFERDGLLTEGSFTSLFVERDGMLVTPPLARGLLPGVLRAELIASNRAVEGDLTPADLADGFFVGNALRGLMRAVVAVAK